VLGVCGFLVSALLNLSARLIMRACMLEILCRYWESTWRARLRWLLPVNIKTRSPLPIRWAMAIDGIFPA
jgi:hypothetical protein